MSDMPTNIPVATDHVPRHARELDALYQVSRILAAGTMQRQMFAAVLDVLHHDLGLLRGTVLLLSPDGQELMLEVSHGLAPTTAQARYRRGEGIVGRVLETGEPAVIPKVSQEPQFLGRIHRRSALDEEVSFICVPVALENTVLGVLSVDRLYDPRASLDEDVRVLSIVASLIANDVRSRRAAEAERQALAEENRRLHDEVADRFRPENIIGNSNAMREVYRAIHQVAATDTTVLIRGESGTGKELVAHALHYAGPRARGPFVRVNCAALSESLLTSELFGHEKGAFTGAVERRKGRIEEAEGGTLFLDEIGDFSPSVQVNLLRVLQEKEYQRVGSSATRTANVRILTATNRDLETAVADERFRQDLYYRINVFPIFLPPLRDRKDDILQLADHFIAKYTKQLSKDVRRISTPAINMMTAYHWPGNVRELENCIERAVLLSTDGVIRGHHLPPSLQTADASDTVGAGTLAERVDLFERDIIVDALKRTEGNMAAAARDLATTPRILRYKVGHLGIEYRQYRRR